MRVSKFGDWTRAGIILQALSKNILPAFKFRLKEDGDYVLEKLKGHIDAQDLSWTPLAESTIALKNGDSTIYVETGFLRDNLKVRKVRSPRDGVTFFIGANAWDKNPDGVKLSDLMIWLEYGTANIPARPLIRPTLDEVDKVLRSNWTNLLRELIRGGK